MVHLTSSIELLFQKERDDAGHDQLHVCHLYMKHFSNRIREQFFFIYGTCFLLGVLERKITIVKTHHGKHFQPLNK